MTITRRDFLKAAGVLAAALALGVKVQAERKPLVAGVGRGSPYIFDNFGVPAEIVLTNNSGNVWYSADYGSTWARLERAPGGGSLRG